MKTEMLARGLGITEDEMEFISNLYVLLDDFEVDDGVIVKAPVLLLDSKLSDEAKHVPRILGCFDYAWVDDGELSMVGNLRSVVSRLRGES